MNSWTIYWITRLDVLKTWLIVGWWAMIVWALADFFIALAKAEEDELERFGKTLPKYLIAIALWGMGIIFIPTTKEAFTMYIVPKIVNNEGLRELPEMAIKVTKQWLLSQLEEVQK